MAIVIGTIAISHPELPVAFTDYLASAWMAKNSLTMLFSVLEFSPVDKIVALKEVLSLPVIFFI